MLVTTGEAPGCPEVEYDDVSSIRCQANRVDLGNGPGMPRRRRAARERGKRKRWRGTAGERRLDCSWVARHAESEQGDRGNRQGHGADCERPSHVPTSTGTR